jgi:hypothetical protein
MTRRAAMVAQTANGMLLARHSVCVILRACCGSNAAKFRGREQWSPCAEQLDSGRGGMRCRKMSSECCAAGAAVLQHACSAERAVIFFGSVSDKVCNADNVIDHSAVGEKPVAHWGTQVANVLLLPR